MTRRSVASLLAAGLLIVLMIAAARMTVPFVTISPGPTIDVLGDNGGKPIVQVEGHKTFPTDGQLRLTTVSITNPQAQVTLLDAMWAWFQSDRDVLPEAAMYPDSSDAEQERAESAAQMVGSQDTAIAVALTELGYHLDTHIEVTGVSPHGPSDGKLEPRDRIVALDGQQVGDIDDLFAALDDVSPGDRVTVEVRRSGADRSFPITTASSPDDPDRAILGVLVGTGYDFPFDVRVRIDDSIGGPSAGLVFALSVYDTLTPGALTDGHVVAGTGTIAPDGKVGPIGGIREKLVAAERADAELFLVPADNCASAVAAPVDHDDMTLVRVDTMHDAVRALQTWTEDPTADLPRCPA
jgi:PDZ domain-containing protein